MSCYHPLKAFKLGTKDNGKSDLKVVPYATDHLELHKGTWRQVPTPEPSMYADRVCREFVEIPCGQCIGCRLDYSRMWADRCTLEMQKYSRNAFVTLTYDDLHVPRSSYTDPATGAVKTSLTLDKRHLQLWMKRLRKKFGDGIRFFSAGEYGDNTSRPHYHAVLFNFWPDDAVPVQQSRLGHTYYSSESLNATWTNGFILLAPCTWETCAYVARYCCKKLRGAEADFYEFFNIAPPFALMSRKPGLAREYYDDNKEYLLTYQKTYAKLPTGGKEIRLPRYFKILLEADFPEAMEKQKEVNRAQAEASKAIRLSRTDLSYLEMLEIAELNKNQSIRSLKRPLD